ncbi:uncharacterized protein V1518DRAFT_422011, partial [Limtongia smithiae]|uniref:uncharacterized protein n=1 Tax=Limtongia smithiae TaxID=1125753 RepID=UPI0034CE8946
MSAQNVAYVARDEQQMAPMVNSTQQYQAPMVDTQTNKYSSAPMVYDQPPSFVDEKEAVAAAPVAPLPVPVPSVSSSSHRYCGMSRLVIICIIALIIVLAVGLGAGLGVGLKHNSSKNSSGAVSSATASIATATTAVTTAFSATTASSTVAITAAAEPELTLTSTATYIEAATSTVTEAAAVTKLCVPDGNLIKEPNFNTDKIADWSNLTFSAASSPIGYFEKFNYTDGTTGGVYLSGFDVTGNSSNQDRALVYQDLLLESNATYSLRFSFRTQLYSDYDPDGDLYAQHITVNDLIESNSTNFGEEFWTWTIDQDVVDTEGYNDTLVTVWTSFTTNVLDQYTDNGNNSRIHFNAGYNKQNMYLFSASLVKGLEVSCSDPDPEILLSDISMFFAIDNTIL